jgi:hypothetical protein
MPDLTVGMVTASRIIARGRRIRDVARLVATYGGRASRWVKKSSPPFDLDGQLYEYHWYEHPGIGRVEIKRKEVAER